VCTQNATKVAFQSEGTFGQLGGIFYVMIAQKSAFWLVSDQVSTSWFAKSMLPHAHKNTKTGNNKMIKK
jgi:hypothetical protein